MRKLVLTATVAALGATVAFAQYKVPSSGTGHIGLPQQGNSGPLQITTANQQPQSISQAPRIGRAEAQKLVKSGKAVYIDVRPRETYDKGHLPGALSIPGSQLLYRLQELPPKKMLITYCACVEEHTAAVAVLNLEAHNIKNAAALTGGWNDWKAAGLPIEVTGAPH